MVELGLCPFAGAVVAQNAVRFAVSSADTPQALLAALEQELIHLDSAEATVTSFLIHPLALADFYDFNQFLDEADHLLDHNQWDGIYQIASFHPDYLFAGADLDAAENFSNRSPFPMLHLLREASVAEAIAVHPDIESVPAHNLATLEQLGSQRLRALWAACLLD